MTYLIIGEYFTAIDLAEIGTELDKQEHNFMYNSEQSTYNNDHEKQQQSSSNFDDSGFFSIQVLQKALSSFNLELIPYQSQNPIALAAQKDPITQQAYICNFKEHWYTIRKFAGIYWFNLNSLFKKPQYVSDTYLSVLLAQLVTDGYSIFIVNGVLPQCQGDETIGHVPKEIIVAEFSASTEINRPNTSGRSQFYQDDTIDDDDDADMKAAIEASLKHDENEVKHDYSFQNAIRSSESELGDDDLKRAIELSLQNNNNKIEEKESVVEKQQATNQTVDLDEVRRKRLEFLDKLQNPKDQA